MLYEHVAKPQLLYLSVKLYLFVVIAALVFNHVLDSLTWPQNKVTGGL